MKDDTIYYFGAVLGYAIIDTQFNVKEDSTFRPSSYIYQLSGQKITYMSEITSSGNFLIVVSSFGDVSMGRLYEYQTNKNDFSLLKDSAYNISSAVYWHGNDNKLVYYSYGNDRGLRAGYYLYNKTTDSDSLLLAYESPAGPLEVINGFDLSPDNQILLIPAVRASRTVFKAPKIVAYNLQTHKADTLNVDFDRMGLWLRYSPDGDRILYRNFPPYVGGSHEWRQSGGHH